MASEYGQWLTSEALISFVVAPLLPALGEVSQLLEARGIRSSQALSLRHRRTTDVIMPTICVRSCHQTNIIKTSYSAETMHVLNDGRMIQCQWRIDTRIRWASNANMSILIKEEAAEKTTTSDESRRFGSCDYRFVEFL